LQKCKSLSCFDEAIFQSKHAFCSHAVELKVLE
jgi:hypothetical protein